MTIELILLSFNAYFLVFILLRMLDQFDPA